MNTQPEALRLADALDADTMVIGYDQAATLLRTQHSEITRYREALHYIAQHWPDTAISAVALNALKEPQCPSGS